MLTALYGPQIRILNILAAMGSLIFQLPIMLILFEYRRFQTGSSGDSGRPAASGRALTEESGDDLARSQSYVAAMDGGLGDPSSHATGRKHGMAPRPLLLLARVVLNPPMAGILLGLLYSLLMRTAGGSAVYPFWIERWVANLALCVSPVAAFTIGMFMAFRELSFLYSWRHGSALLVAKFGLLPLLALGLARVWGFEGRRGRSAVLIASLPIAVAAFSISKKYFYAAASRKHTVHGLVVSSYTERETTLISGQVIVGSIIMTPIFLAWHAVLQEGNVFDDETASAMTNVSLP